MKKVVDMLVNFNPSPPTEEDELFADEEDKSYEEEGFASKYEK